MRLERGATAAAVAASRTPVDVTADITFVADPTQYDVTSRELVIPLRLKNTGARTLTGPITIAIRRFGSGLGAERREMAPSVLNASNQVSGAGATFVLSEALGTERVLRPGDTSGPVEMRFRVRDPLSIPDLHLVVTSAIAVSR